jgi:hypothetical protein
VQAATPAIIYAGGKSGDRHMDAITPVDDEPIHQPLFADSALVTAG